MMEVIGMAKRCTRAVIGEIVKWSVLSVLCWPENRDYVTSVSTRINSLVWKNFRKVACMLHQNRCYTDVRI